MLPRGLGFSARSSKLALKLTTIETVVALDKLQLKTLEGIRDQLASYNWSDAELMELVDPKLGIITGFQDLLDQLEILRRIDLEQTPPCAEIKPAK